MNPWLDYIPFNPPIGVPLDIIYRLPHKNVIKEARVVVVERINGMRHCFYRPTDSFDRGHGYIKGYVQKWRVAE